MRRRWDGEAGRQNQNGREIVQRFEQRHHLIGYVPVHPVKVHHAGHDILAIPTGFHSIEGEVCGALDRSEVERLIEPHLGDAFALALALRPSASAPPSLRLMSLGAIPRISRRCWPPNPVTTPC